jgi:hypothetical protein
MIIALVVACEKSVVAPSDPIKVKGILVDKQNIPIPNAVMEAVLVQKSKTAILADEVLQRDTTDEDGNFEFSSLQNDLTNVDLRIIHPDLKPFQENFIKTLGNQDRSKVVVQMQYQDTCCGRIELTVRSAKDSSIISGVEVRLNQGSTIKRKSSTNSEGRIVFEEVCGGTYWVRLSKTGFNVRETDGIRVEGCDSSNYVNRTLYMAVFEKDSCCNGVMKINPVDIKTGNLLTGAIVKLRKNGTELSRLSVGNEPVVFRELCKGTYSMLISKDGFTTMEFAVEMDCSDTVEVKKELSAIECCNGVINIKVQDSTGAAIREATINLFKGSTKVGTVYTNAEGRVTMTGICQGDYSFSIIRTNYKSIEFSQTMGCDDTVNIEKTLYYNGADTCCKGIIKVYPKDASTKAALNGATVKMFIGDKLIKTETVVEGSAIFKELCSGKYSFIIIKEGYKSTDFSIELPCNQTKEFEKLMNRTETDSCCNGVAKIFVRNSGGERLYNALVKLWKGGTLLGEYRTNNDGYVIFTRLCPGTYGVSMGRDGYKGQEFNFTIGCNDTVTYEKNLVASETDSCCNGVVKIIVKDAQGNRLTPATVRLWKNGTKLSQYTTNNDGAVVFTRLCEGTYGIDISKDGYTGMEFSFTLDCNDTVVYEKTINAVERDSCCNGVVKFIFKNEGGEALANTGVKVTKSGTIVRSGPAGLDGTITFRELCRGIYAIRVARDGYKVQEFNIEIGCNDTVEVERTLVRETCCTAIFKLHVQDDSTGTAISDARIEVRKNGDIVFDGYTNPEGNYGRENICAPDSYLVRIIKDGYVIKEFTLIYTDCIVKTETIQLRRN